MQNEGMVLTTLESLPGMDIDEHIGLVSGMANFSRPWIKTLALKLKSVFGGEMAYFNNELEDLRKKAMEAMINHAKTINANAIINIRFENCHIDLSFAEVYVYGTAVKATKY